jgi:peroxiredoxin Q/BCP
LNTLKPGDKAPDFSSVDQDGNIHKLSDYKGKKLVVFFYPQAGSQTCTKEACNLRDNFSRLKKSGYALLGVSADSPKKQGNFRKKYGLPYPLLADEDKKLVDAFGVWGPKKFMGRIFDTIHRITFVINEKGVIEKVIDNVTSVIHADQILGTEPPKTTKPAK